GDDDLVDERFVVVAREHGVGSVHLRRRLALFVEEFELHQAAPLALLAAAAFDGAFTAGRTTTWPFLAPGTAPRTSSSWRASSMRTMSRFCVVRLTLPSWPDIFLPGNTRPGSCAIEIEPGTLCERLLPCEARCEPKWWRLIVPEKPLPIVVPWTSTRWPTAKTPIGTCPPALYSAATASATRNSWTTSPATTPALARWPASGLETREAFLSPKTTWSAA